MNEMYMLYYQNGLFPQLPKKVGKKRRNGMSNSYFSILSNFILYIRKVIIVLIEEKRRACRLYICISAYTKTLIESL